jgi:hypothetical protein
MPVIVWRCCPGSAGRDPAAEARLSSLWSDLTHSVVPVSVFPVIGVDAVLPRPLSCLLGVLHLFAHFGIVMVSADVRTVWVSEGMARNSACGHTDS